MISFLRLCGINAIFFSSVMALGSGNLEPVTSQNLFIPHGFDDNDRSVVVLDGYLLTSCHQLDISEKIINLEEKTITITQFARITPGPCMTLPVPFSVEVDLGVLPAGEYKIATNQNELTGFLTVSAAVTTSQDNFLYAPVEQARVKRARDGYQFAVLEGRFTNTCMALKEVKVYYTGNTIEVLPIMVVSDNGDCQAKEVEFRKVQRLNHLRPGRYLLHVRSLNGQAKEVVFTVVDSGDPA